MVFHFQIQTTFPDHSDATLKHQGTTFENYLCLGTTSETQPHSEVNTYIQPNPHHNRSRKTINKHVLKEGNEIQLRTVKCNPCQESILSFSSERLCTKY